MRVSRRQVVTGSANEAFDELMDQLDYSMLIVTARAGPECAGCLVGFATQCSIEPPRFLVCISERNRTFGVACRSGSLVVHFPTAVMRRLVSLFGAETGDHVDKFAAAGWHLGPRGLPVLDDCPRWFAGEILERRPMGDHTGFLLAPFAALNEAPGAGFPFREAKRLPPGHPA